MKNKFKPKKNIDTKLSENNEVQYLILPRKYRISLYANTVNKFSESIYADSILNKNMLILFNHIDDDTRQHILNIDNVLINHLFLSDEERDFIDLIKIYDEEPLFYLFILSLNYLIKNNIPRSLYNKLTTSLPLFDIKAFNLSKNFNPSFSSKEPIFNINNLEWLLNYPLQILPNYEFIYWTFNKLGIKDWFDISTMSEMSILMKLSISHEAIFFIYKLWEYKFEIDKLKNELNACFPIEDYNNLLLLLNKFVGDLIEEGRDKEIIMKRLGFYNNQNWTLEKIGEEYNLTRERIRQIEKKYLPRLKKRKSKKNLERFWFTLTTYLNHGGGICTINEFLEFCKIIWDWATYPQPNIIMSLISLSSDFKIVEDEPVIIKMVYHKCINCKSLKLYLSEELSDTTRNMIPMDEVLSGFKERCISHCNYEKTIIPCFSYGYIIDSINQSEDFKIEGEYIYTNESWSLNYLKNRCKIVEQVLLKNKRAMHYSEVYSEIAESNIQLTKVTPKNIYGIITRVEELFLWDKGTYIHRDYVKIPIEIIKEIEKFIIECLNDNRPFISASGIYTLFREKLKNENIPNEHALYSVLKNTSPDLLLTDFPYMQNKSKAKERLPIPVVFEEFIKEKGGGVNTKEIKEFGTKTLYLSENISINNIPNILHFDKNQYIHIDNIAIKKNDLIIVSDYVNELLIKSGYVSVDKIFKDKIVTCRLLDIQSSNYLYSLLNYFYNDTFNFSRYPSIYKIEEQETENDSKSIAKEIESFIKSKTIPCSYEELTQHFVIELGYSPITLNISIQSKKNIIKYSEGSFLHIDNLNWSKEKQEVLTLIAENHLDERKKIGIKYGSITDVYELCFSLLPELFKDLLWTKTLLRTMICFSDNFTLIGTQKNAFIGVPNEYNINTLDDLIYSILKDNFSGAAEINLFVHEMYEAGILQKSLTSTMLGFNSRLTIEDDIIRLAELY